MQPIFIFSGGHSNGACIDRGVQVGGAVDAFEDASHLWNGPHRVCERRVAKAVELLQAFRLVRGKVPRLNFRKARCLLVFLVDGVPIHQLDGLAKAKNVRGVLFTGHLQLEDHVAVCLQVFRPGLVLADVEMTVSARGSAQKRGLCRGSFSRQVVTAAVDGARIPQHHGGQAIVGGQLWARVKEDGLGLDRRIVPARVPVDVGVVFRITKRGGVGLWHHHQTFETVVPHEDNVFFFRWVCLSGIFVFYASSVCVWSVKWRCKK